jgi:hypothetical protein
MPELEHVVVALQAAEHLADPIHHATAKSFHFRWIRVSDAHPGRLW